MSYVDGFVLAVPKKQINAYKRLAQKASKIFMKHGATSYFEAAADDLKVKMGIPYPKLLKATKEETVVFAWITYKSRKDRDAVNKAIMKDPEMKKLCSNDDMPFNPKRMSYGGFKIIAKGK
jgi:uncharacterized protein YbaA (DUF1428 family)